jgi:hypothetical protein
VSSDPVPFIRYLQSGHAAATAAVPNIATKAAARPTSFIFIAPSPIDVRADNPPVTSNVKVSSRLEGQALDLQADLKVF